MSTTHLGIYDEVVESVHPITGLVKMKRTPHVHTKHNVGMMLAGPSPTGLTINRIQVSFCPKCHLVWFEELPDAMPGGVPGGNHG